MSLSDKKRNILSVISSYTSYMQQKNVYKNSDLYSSINNKKEILPYLLDILKVVAGIDGSKFIIGDLLSKIIIDSEIKYKDTLKKLIIQHNYDLQLPNNFKNNGIDVPLKNIDVKNKFKINPSSIEGNLIYDNTNNNDFDNIIYNSIKNPNNTIIYNNIAIKYNEISDSINVKPYNSNNKKIGEFLNEFIDNSKFFKKNELTTYILDDYFGSFSNKINKTKKELYDELYIKKYIEKFINNEDDINFNNNDINEINEQVDKLYNNIVEFNLVCGIFNKTLDFDKFTNVINEIININDNSLITNKLDSLLDNICDNLPDNLQKNKQNFKDNYYNKLIDSYIKNLIYLAIFQPQVRLFLIMYQSFLNISNYDPTKDTYSEYMKNMHIFIKCLIKELFSLIIEFIYKTIIVYLLNIFSPLITKIVKEKINSFYNIIRSLVK